MSLRKYWTEKLNLDIAGPYIYTNKNTEARTEYSETKLYIGNKITDSVVRRCNNNKTLINLFLLSCTGYVLHKQECSKEIILCQPIANSLFNERNISNILCLKSYITEKDSFKQYLLRMRSEYEISYENVNYDIMNLLKSKEIKSLIILKGYNDVGCETIENAKSIIEFAIEEKKGISLKIRYGKDTFNEEIINRFIKQIVKVLELVSDNPETKLLNIQFLSRYDKNIIDSLNDTDIKLRKKTFIDLYYSNLDKIKDKPALIDKSEIISYAELEKYSNVLANEICESGIQPGSIIGIALSRTKYLFIAQLAIIKIGCCYVPIDPTYPQHRIDYVIEKSNVNMLITDDMSLEKRHKKALNINNIKWNRDAAVKHVNVSGDDLAYIIFTSGSTGNPKGVMISHDSLINFIESIYLKLKLNQSLNVLSITTISFDIFVLESLMPMAKGLTITIADEHCQNNPTELADLIEKNKVDLIQTTPSRMKMLLGSNSFCNSIKRLKMILIGGEAFPKALLSQLRYITGASIYNMYGPTETTVWSTIKDLSYADQITIGTPIYNTRIAIIDFFNKLQPVGLPGELCIGGAGVSNGYINNDDLTREKFVIIDGERVYKTGDYAYINNEQEIEYIGRTDSQIKVRGHRIELAEIEEAMNEYKDIKLTAVIVKQDNDDNKYLEAYFEGYTSIKISDLKGYLKERLPEYMLPDYYFQIEKMPLTPNLKIDRKMLFEIKTEKEVEKNIIVQPQNEIQTIILEYWKHFFDNSNIGITDNFFDLGGNSLKAVQLATILMDKFTLDANAIFKYPTVKLLENNIHYKENNFEAYIAEQKYYANRLMEIQNDSIFDSQYKDYVNKCKKIDSYQLEEKYSFKNILLTGASGYLGIHLLYEILHMSTANIYLFVRRRNSDSPAVRISKLFEKIYGNGSFSAYKNRIYIIEADLEYNYLGLSKKTYYAIQSKIDCIFHAAANVSHFGTYNDFRLPNIIGTKNLIDFALSDQKPLFNYISTQGIGFELPDTCHRVLFSEFDSVEKVQIDNYYLQTKAEAENLVKEAKNRGLHYRIFRIGTLFSDYIKDYKAPNYQNMAIYRLTNSFRQLGLIPDLNQVLFDYSFVDDVSKAIWLLAETRNLNNEVFHISNSEKIFLRDIGKYFDTSCKILDPNDFFDQLYKLYKSKVSAK